MCAGHWLFPAASLHQQETEAVNSLVTEPFQPKSSPEAVSPRARCNRDFRYFRIAVLAVQEISDVFIVPSASAAYRV